MQGIPLNERKRLGALLDDRPQTEVMAMIPQFSQAETDNFVAPPAQIPEALGVLMFNMERGVNLPEIQEFLRDCPDIQPFDVILANELDDGCARSGNKNTARELAQAFGLNYAWGLEFIELVNDENAKGFHGNAVFSRWPIRRAGVIRLPEQYNWYFDRQKRIGGRLAVFAAVSYTHLDVCKRQAVIPPGDGHLRLVHRWEQMTGVVQHQRHLSKAHRGAFFRAAEDHVLHFAAPEGLAGLLAHDPADGVGNVSLAGAVRPHDGRNILTEVQDRLIREGFEALHLQC